MEQIKKEGIERLYFSSKEMAEITADYLGKAKKMIEGGEELGPIAIINVACDENHSVGEEHRQDGIIPLDAKMIAEGVNGQTPNYVPSTQKLLYLIGKSMNQQHKKVISVMTISESYTLQLSKAEQAKIDKLPPEERKRAMTPSRNPDKRKEALVVAMLDVQGKSVGRMIPLERKDGKVEWGKETMKSSDDTSKGSMGMMMLQEFYKGYIGLN